MQTKYNSFKEADESNWKLIEDIFGKDKHFIIMRPKKNNSYYDGLVFYRKNGIDHLVLVEVKRRQFDSSTLERSFGNKFILEQHKYKNLHNSIKKDPQVSKLLYKSGRVPSIWYISETSDGHFYIHDITNRKYDWYEIESIDQTYAEVQQKKIKKVAYLSIDEVIYKK